MRSIAEMPAARNVAIGLTLSLGLTGVTGCADKNPQRDNTVVADADGGAPVYDGPTTPDYSQEPTLDPSPSESASASSSQTPSAEASASPSRSKLPPYVAGGVPLNATNYCAWTPANPMPRAGQNSYKLDGRCASDRSGTTIEPVTTTASNGVGIYKKPEATFANILGRVPDGTPATGVCIASGAEETNKAEVPVTANGWMIIDYTNKSGDGLLKGQGLVMAEAVGYNAGSLPVCTPAQLAIVAAKR
jgi:hypothetical protein